MQDENFRVELELTKMVSKQDPFTQLSAPLLTVESYAAHPQYYVSKSNDDMIIFGTDTDDKESSPGIIMFNLNNSTYLKIDYPSTTLQTLGIPMFPGNAFDSKRNKLYVFNGYHKYFISCVVDTYQTNHIKLGDRFNVAGWTKALYIPDPIDEIHLFESSRHFRFDTNKDEMTKCGTFNSLGRNAVRFVNPIYIQSLQRLMLFGGNWNQEIFCCKLYEKNQENYEWESYDKIMPHRAGWGSYHVILAFDVIVFVFYLRTAQNYDIWCLDLKFESEEWYKCGYKCKGNEDGAIEYQYVVKARNNDVHIIGFGDDTQCHTKVSLFDLVPMDLYEMHSKHYQLLVIGYFKKLNQESDLNYPQIPSVLIDLVSLYYPALL